MKRNYFGNIETSFVGERAFGRIIPKILISPNAESAKSYIFSPNTMDFKQESLYAIEQKLQQHRLIYEKDIKTFKGINLFQTSSATSHPAHKT